MGAERQTNIHTYTHTHTLFVKQFQETSCAPTAGLRPGLKTITTRDNDDVIGRSGTFVKKEKCENEFCVGKQFFKI